MAEEGAGKSPELKIRIVVDEEGSKVGEQIKNMLEEPVKESGKKAGGSFLHGMGEGMQAGAVFLGGLYMKIAEKALEGVKDLFTEPIHAFMESQKQVKQLAGDFAMLDQSGASLARIREIASDTKDELEDLGMKAGVADDTLVNTFDNIIARGGKSIEQAKELTEQFAYAGRAIPGGAEGISEAYSNIEAGIIRARNPIVAMISATHLLKGNAKQVASEMQKMTQEQQLELAEKAIGRMADKMKDAPMGFKQLQTSLNVFKENLFEEAGAPMVKGLTNALRQFRALFFDAGGNKTKLAEDMMAAAARIGDVLAHTFELGSSFFQGMAEQVSFADEEIRTAWGWVFGESGASFQSMVDQSKLAGQVFMEGIKGAIVALGVAVAGIQETVRVILTQAGNFMRATGSVLHMSSLEDVGKNVARGANVGARDDILAKVRSTGGGSLGELGKSYAENAGQMGGVAEAEYQGRWAEAVAERQRLQKVVDDAQIQMTTQHAQDYLAAYGEAAKAHDEAAMQNIARFLKSNAQMATSIGELAPDIIEGGVKGFVATLKTVGNKEMAELIEGLQKKNHTLAIGKGATINQNFSGPINIKQDFKDQDPDRVVSAFTEKLARTGAARIQARTAPVFGW